MLDEANYREEATGGSTLFSNHAAGRAFEHDVAHAALLDALESGHFKQPGFVRGQYAHYVRVDGRPFKVITGVSLSDPANVVIIELYPLRVATA